MPLIIVLAATLVFGWVLYNMTNQNNRRKDK